MLCDRLGLSERRACRIYRPEPLHAALLPTGGARRRRLAQTPAQDLRRQASLGLPPRPRAPAHRGLERQQEAGPEDLARGGASRACQGQEAPAPGISTAASDRLKAERPNHVWALDFQHDATSDGRELKFLNVVDEFTREALAIEVDRSIDAEETVAVLKRLATERGAPANLRADNSPELTAAVLREWCRHGSTGTAYIEPGSPWQNPYIESFNAHLRDELLNVEVFTCLEEARALAADWRTDYNANHPHSALGMMSPGNTNGSVNPGLSLGVDR